MARYNHAYTLAFSLVSNDDKGHDVDARQLRAALRNATNRYRAGYTSYIEQLDAQRGLLTAELALVQARADRLTAYAQLYQAMGGGWSREAIEATQR